MKDSDFLTPGRIRHVYLFPQKSYDALEGKRAGWAKRTYGRLTKDNLPSQKSSTPPSLTLPKQPLSP